MEQPRVPVRIPCQPFPVWVDINLWAQWVPEQEDPEECQRGSNSKSNLGLFRLGPAAYLDFLILPPLSQGSLWVPNHQTPWASDPES